MNQKDARATDNCYGTVIKSSQAWQDRTENNWKPDTNNSRKGAHKTKQHINIIL